MGIGTEFLGAFSEPTSLLFMGVVAMFASSVSILRCVFYHTIYSHVFFIYSEP